MLTPIKALTRREDLSALITNSHRNKGINHDANPIHTFISPYQHIKTQATQTERKPTQGLMSHEEFTFLIVYHTVRLTCDAVLRVDAILLHVFY